MSETSETYNGWTNYETWVVGLWFDNDEATYTEVRDIARDWLDDPADECDYCEAVGSTDNHDAHRVGELADALQAFAEDLPEYQRATENASFVSDLLGSALGRVNWRELAESYLSELAEEATR